LAVALGARRPDDAQVGVQTGLTLERASSSDCPRAADGLRQGAAPHRTVVSTTRFRGGRRL